MMSENERQLLWDIQELKELISEAKQPENREKLKAELKSLKLQHRYENE